MVRSMALAMIDVTISEEEAREFYEEHKAELALPERVRVRHVFLSALKHEPDEAESVLGAQSIRLEQE